MRDTKIQWHPGFVAAMDLELSKNRHDLIFEKEYNLNTKPLEIDLLIVRKNTDIPIDNEIGHMFRGHNIIEYKAPADHLNIDTFYKATAYACLYKASGPAANAIRADDVTVSLVRAYRPARLFQYFKEQHYTVSHPYHGVYYILGNILFPTQIIVTEELEPGTHIWLRSLSENMGKQDLAALLRNMEGLTGDHDRELADSVLEVTIQANKQLIELLKGDDDMGETLLKIMEPQLLLIKKQGIEEGRKEGQKEGRKEGRREGIQGTVDVLRELHYGDADIRALIKKKYGLTDADTDEYL